jgi:tripartite-type tricarboxylate transporter receptor subunit TctC
VKPFLLRLWATGALAAASLITASPASAQTYPSTTVRLIVPFAAGGPADIQARWLAVKLARELGQQFIVENKGGAGGIIGAQAVATAAPDGHTLLFASVGAIAITPYLSDKVPYDPKTDLIPVVRVATASTVLVTSVNSPFRSLPELVGYGRQHPGKLSFASAGAGTTTHLGGELLKREAKLDMVHVPYRGAGPAITDLIAGTVDMMFADGPVVMPHIKAGKLRALGVASVARAPALADTPTTAEGGQKDVLVATWYGLLAPGQTPPEVVQRINKAINDILSTPEAKAYFGDQGMQINGGSAAEFRTFIASESLRWPAVAKAAGVKLE